MKMAFKTLKMERSWKVICFMKFLSKEEATVSQTVMADGF